MPLVRAVQAALLRNSIILFMKREDNSTCLPGKKDCVTDGGQKQQKYILSEFPSKTCSLSFFAKCRPRHMLLVHFSLFMPKTH